MLSKVGNGQSPVVIFPFVPQVVFTVAIRSTPSACAMIVITNLGRRLACPRSR